MADRPNGTQHCFFVEHARHCPRFGGGCTEWPTAGQHYGTRLDERGIAQDAITIALNLQRKAL